MSNASFDAGDGSPSAGDTAVLLAGLNSENPGNPETDSPDLGASDGNEEPLVPPPPTFAALGLQPEIQTALDDMGYFSPTPVQTAVYEKVMAGKDLMVQSRTGTGKTTAFGLPIISSVEVAKRAPQAIILTPTRELALQVSRELAMLAKHKGVAVETIYGGAPIGKQIDALRNGVHIVVGTPGRVLDHIGRRTLDLKGVRFFVLDECDEMLSMGFLEDIERIAAHVPKERQTLLFSATMPDEVRRYAKRQMREPEHVALSTGNISLEEIHHAYYIVSGVARARDLLRILAVEKPESAIIFCNTRDETGMVARFLVKQGFDAEALSSDLSQSDRERVMKRMKDKNLHFLVATDVAARGIDIIELSHVINFSFPESAEVYVHRTGRTGRAGKKGTALSLIGPRELGSFWYLKLLYKIQPEERDLPPASVLDGVLKTPLPRLGPPPPPDALLLLRGAIDVTREPTEEHLALAKRILAEADAEKLVALLAGAKIDEVNAAKAAARVAADTARKEREERDRAERTERYGEREERPRYGDREERPRFGRDGGSDRPRFGRDGGGDRPRTGGADGERPRFGRDGGGDAERPRYGRDRDRPEARSDRPDARPDARPEARPEARTDRDRPEPRTDRDRPEARTDGDRPEPRTDHPDRAERDRFRDERAQSFERAAERVEREERANREAREAGAEQPAAARTDGQPASGEARPERNEARRDERGGRDRDRGRGGRDRGGPDREARPERNDRPAEGAPAATPAPKARHSIPTEGRDFWETWADEKSSRVAEPARETRAEEPSIASDPAPREPRRDRDDGPRRERGRGRDRHRDDGAGGRPERSRDASAAPATPVPPAVSDPASQVRLHVNLGKKHGVTADDIRRLLGEDLGGDAASIGSVAMRDTYCHVRVPSNLAEPILAAMNGKAHGEVTVKVELART